VSEYWSEEGRHDLIESVKTTYAGLRKFLYYYRHPENGITTFFMFDLDANPLEPIYATRIHPRDLLVCGPGMVTPMESYQEHIDFMVNGKAPPGVTVVEVQYGKAVEP
jgi:hypothetical protein